jgi:fucose permease
MAIFILFVFPANIILEKGGLKLGVLSGILLTAIGMWIKCLVNHGFGWVFVGQFIAAIGQPLLGCAGAKMAAFWFGENERVIAITIGTVA